MLDRVIGAGFTVLLILFPLAMIGSGYLVLTAHLQGIAAAVFGWCLFLGGWVSVPMFISAIVELNAKTTRI